MKHTKIGFLCKSFLVAALLSLCSISSFAQSNKVIYGKDDRLDIYQIDPAKYPQVLGLARSTVALFDGMDVAVDTEKNIARLNLVDFGARMRICPKEPFFGQFSGAFCSGSLVGPDLIMTAGHCIQSEQECQDVKFVFDFAIREQGGNSPTQVAATAVYGCKKVIAHRLDPGTGVDYTIAQLDRPATDRYPLKIRREPNPDLQAGLVVIGHPSGLPTKVAGNAKIRRLEDGYFVANLDTYGGNSGSAVFNSKTGIIEGILVRGENDYVTDPQGGGCRVSNRCDDNGCRGEDVTNVFEVAKFVPEMTKRMPLSRAVRPSKSLEERPSRRWHYGPMKKPSVLVGRSRFHNN